jgi:hypothetical protein
MPITTSSINWTRPPCLEIVALLPNPLSDLLKEEIMSLEPDVSPWLSDTFVNHFFPALPPGHHFGFSTEDDTHFTRVKVLALIPGSFAHTHLSDKNVVNK